MFDNLTKGNHMSDTNLITLWREQKQGVAAGSFTRARARERLHEEMKGRLLSDADRIRRLPAYFRINDLRDTLSYQFNGQLSDLAEYIRGCRVKNKRFGVALAQALKDDSDEDALELINSNAYRNIRDNTRTNWRDWMNERFSNNYCSCDDCNTITHEDDGASTYEGDYWVCQECLDDSYSWSDRRDTYISNEDYTEDEGDEDNGVIHSYHHSKNRVCHIPSAYDKIDNPAVLLGLELEMECSEDYSRAEKAQVLYDRIHEYNAGDTTYPYGFFEEDGSLNYGFELVTSYTGLDVHAKQLLVFRDNPVRGLRSHDTNSCGLHVHVSRAGMTTFHACKLAFFVHDSNNQHLLRALARRSNSRHAKMVNKKADSQWIKNAKRDGISRLNDDRYEAVNFQNSATVEFRLFKGTLRYESIMACLEFAYITWFFSRDMGVTELTTDKFLEYICKPEKLKHTKFLRDYLRSKNFSLPIKVKQPKAEVVEV
jgi:hypothetical protein